MTFIAENYIFYQYIVASLIIVVVMVTGDVCFSQTFHKFITMGGGGGCKCQLLAKILAICQLSVKF